MDRKSQLSAAINARRAERAFRKSQREEIFARSAYEWEKYKPNLSVSKLPETLSVRRHYPFCGIIRISQSMRREMEELFLYSGPNYKRQDLSKQYRELMENNPNRAREPQVVRWYVKKWRKIK